MEERDGRRRQPAAASPPAAASQYHDGGAEGGAQPPTPPAYALSLPRAAPTGHRPRLTRSPPGGTRAGRQGNRPPPLRRAAPLARRRGGGSAGHAGMAQALPAALGDQSGTRVAGGWIPHRSGLDAVRRDASQRPAHLNPQRRRKAHSAAQRGAAGRSALKRGKTVPSVTCFGFVNDFARKGRRFRESPGKSLARDVINFPF